jgi:hypothetical protein
MRLHELPPDKRTRIISCNTAKLSAPLIGAEPRQLTYPGHEWLLPRADVQLNPYVPPPVEWVVPMGEQRVEQTVEQTVEPTVDIPANVPIFQRINNTPPIMNAPNPLQKRKLKLTKRMHSRRTQNNVPGSVLIITPTAPRHLIANRPPPPITIPQRSPQMAGKTVMPKPTRIPRVHFIPVDGGLRSKNFISQEAINFLTECVWADLPNICTPTKFKAKSAPSCLDFAQVAMPVVHPTTGETINSYNCLMHGPATAEVWQMAFSKDFGGMAQGDIKTGQKGTNSILS